MLADASSLVGDAWADAWTPDPVKSVCEWADEHIVLPDASAEAGRFRSSRTPYVAEILESLSPHSPVQRVVWLAGAQVGKTQTGLNWLAASMHMWPSIALIVEPNLDVSKKLSQQKLGPLIQNTDVLAERLAHDGDKLFQKDFAGGGQITLVGAKSPSGLRSLSVRYLLIDELDAYDADLKDEGSPLSLAEARTASYQSKRKVFLTSTPTVKGFSAIENEFLKTDQRRYFVPCPHCGHFQLIDWKRIRFNKEAPTSAMLLCEDPECGALIEEHHKTRMLEAGEWRATATSQNGTRGYHISALYSPYGWYSWLDAAKEWVEALKDPLKMKSFINLKLAETWEASSEGVDPNSLKSRLESYDQVPNAVRILTAAVDVQKDRLEVKVKGYGAQEESWLIAYHVEDGDPSKDEVWFKLDEFLAQTFTREDGGEMRIDTTLVDSSFLTETVYRYCARRANRRIFALKGSQTAGRPIVGNPSMSNRYRLKLWIIGLDQAKELITRRMRELVPGPGYMHLPDQAWCDDEYLAQLTSEKPLWKWKSGRALREWKNVRERNEAFDLEVYCLAALYTRGQRKLDELLDRRRPVGRRPVAPAEPAETGEAPLQLETTPVPKGVGSLVAAQAAGAKPKWGSQAAKSRWGR